MKLIIYSDGGGQSLLKADPGPVVCSFVALRGDGTHLASGSQQLIGTVNQAEYAGMGMAARRLPELLAKYPAAREIEFRSDSQVMVKGMNGDFKLKDRTLKAYAAAAHKLIEATNRSYYFTYIPREENDQADYLCDLAIDGQIKEDIWTPAPERPHKQARPSVGQLFRAGRLKSARSLKVDPEGFALCDVCKVKLPNCQCGEFVVEVPGMMMAEVSG